MSGRASNNGHPECSTHRSLRIYSYRLCARKKTCSIPAHPKRAAQLLLRQPLADTQLRETNLLRQLGVYLPIMRRRKKPILASAPPLQGYSSRAARKISIYLLSLFIVSSCLIVLYVLPLLGHIRNWGKFARRT